MNVNEGFIRKSSRRMRNLSCHCSPYRCTLLLVAVCYHFRQAQPFETDVCASLAKRSVKLSSSACNSSDRSTCSGWGAATFNSRRK